MKLMRASIAALLLLPSSVGLAVAGSAAWVTFEVRGMKKTASGAT